MKSIYVRSAILGLVSAVGLLLATSTSLAAEFVLDSAGFAKDASTNSVLVGFSGNAEITDSQVDVLYDSNAVKVNVKAFGSAGCANPRPGLIRVISPDTNGKALGEKMGAYCQISVIKLKGGSGVADLRLANAFCSGIGGVEKPCSVEASAK